MKSVIVDDSNCVDHIFSRLDRMIYDEFVKRLENNENISNITTAHVNRCQFCDEVIKNNGLDKTDFEALYKNVELVYFNHSDLWRSKCKS